MVLEKLDSHMQKNKVEDSPYITEEVKWKLLSHVRLFVTPWSIQSVEFSRPEYWSG